MPAPRCASVAFPYGARLDRKTYWRLIIRGDRKMDGDEVFDRDRKRWKRSKLPNGFAYMIFGFTVRRRRVRRE